MSHSTQNVRHKLVLAMVLAVASMAAAHVSFAADKKQEISRVIAKEMTAAQKALQAGQWQEALKNLDAASEKSGLTPFDKKTIFDFKAFADVRLNKLKDAQENYEQALATGSTRPRKRPRPSARCSAWPQATSSTRRRWNTASRWRTPETRTGTTCW